jgi:uncharacterized FlaG/YvyC family protein
MYRKAHEGVGEKVLAAEIQTGNQRTANSFQNTLNLIRNNATSPDGVIKDWDNAIYHYRDLNGLDPQEEQRLITEGRQAALDMQVRYTPQAGNTIKQIENTFNQLAATGPTEGGTYATVSGAKDTIETAKKGAILGQWSLNIKSLAAQDSAYDTARQNFQTALQSDDPNRIQTSYNDMMRLYQNGKAQKDRAIGADKSEYNPDDTARINAMFPAPPTIPKPRGAGGVAGSGKNASQLMEDYLAMWATGKQYGGYEAEEAKGLFAHDIARDLAEHGVDNTPLVDSFFNSLDKGIKKINPQWDSQVLVPTKNFIESLATDKTIDKGSKELIYSRVTEGLLDMVGDMGLKSKTPEQWAQTGWELARISAGITIDGMAITPAGDSAVPNLQGNFSTGNLIKTYKTLQEHPELLHQTAAGETGALVDMSLLDGVQKQAQADVAATLHVDPKNILPSWDAEGKNDIAPIPVIIVPSGPEKGQYKYQVNGKDELWLMKKDTDGNWTEYRKGSAGQNLSTEKNTLKQRQKHEETIGIINRIISHKDDTGFRIPRGYNLPSDLDFYIEGYDPSTGESIKEIPSDVARKFNAAWGGVTKDRWEEIQQGWAAKGISISDKTAAQLKQQRRVR